MVVKDLEHFKNRPRRRSKRPINKTPEIPDWEPTWDEIKFGARTEVDDGTYIIKERDACQTKFYDLLRKAERIAIECRHADPYFWPAKRYDSIVAVRNCRIVGAAFAENNAFAKNIVDVCLKEDGTPYTTHEELKNDNHVTFDENLNDRPVVHTIWVQPERRREGIGKELLTTLAKHFNLPVEGLGFRFPLSVDAFHMLKSMGISKAFGSF